jgi:signal transduction histidine kinase
MNSTPPVIDPYTLVFTVGVLYTIMPLTVWSVLRGRQAPRSTGLWCLGAMFSGVAFMLFGLRMTIPSVLSFQVANILSYVGFAMRWAALRREREASVPHTLLLALVLAASLAYLLVMPLGTRVRLLYSAVVLLIPCACLAREANLLGRRSDSRSARMIAVTYGAVALASVLRIVVLLVQDREPTAFDFTADAYLLQVAGIASALWGNIGFLGVAMERAQAAESAGREALAVATARHDAAERQATALKNLSEERQELLRVISHEVRQPLHNAQAVLQGVEGSLRSEQAGSEAAAARFARARSVLRQITASLDNTLAVSTLLVEGRAPPLRDADVTMMVELCLGDLPPQGRSRVNVAYEADVRTAAMDIGLMRLALRNLLNNALAYSVPGSLVTLRISDSDEPLLLRLDVEDVGPPIESALLPTLFDRGTRGRHDLPGQGLGLYIVQQAMRRQGGSVEVHSTPQGNRFTLLLPQGVEPA